MSQATPEMEIVRSFLKALEAQDLDQALTHVSNDVEYQNGSTVLTERTDAVLIGPFASRSRSAARSRSATSASSCGATPSTGPAAWSTRATLPRPCRSCGGG